MADLTKDFKGWDAPNVTLTDDVVTFYQFGEAISVDLKELAAFVYAAVGGNS